MAFFYEKIRNTNGCNLAAPRVTYVKINGRVVLPVSLPPFSVVEGVGDAVDAVGGFVVCLCSNLSIENIIILNSEILMKKVIKQVT